MAKSTPQSSVPSEASPSAFPLVASAALLIVLAVAAVYVNSLHGMFIFDDVITIRDNPDIRQLWPLWRVLEPVTMRGLTSSGRPLVALSLAINYAIGGNWVEGYHLFNVAVHALAALALFGLVRRTLLGWRQIVSIGSEQAMPPSLGFAFVVALLWAVHPLQTEAVAYIVQRAEAMMALFYLLTLYCFVRYAREGWGWGALCVICCLLGMGCKEVMVSAPIVVLVYDRVFVSGSFGESWRRHRWVLLGLASSWLFLGYEVAITGNRGGTAGYGANVAWWQYALTQAVALMRYLRLSAWPHPLVFDYGTHLEARWAVIIPCLVASCALVAAVVWASIRRPAAGFIGFFFLAVLAPTTSVVPVATQVMAEHRMYLPLAALIAFVAWFAYRYLRKVPVAGVAFALAAAVGLGWAAHERNLDYLTDESIWRSATTNYPDNARSHCNLGFVLEKQERIDESMQQFEEALRIDPTYADAENNLGAAYFKKGVLPESVVHFRNALSLDQNLAGAHYNLGGSLVRMGQVDEGLWEFKEALRLNPQNPEAHYDLATALASLRRQSEAIPEFEEALRIRPDYTDALTNLSTAKLDTGHPDEALALYRRVLVLEPNSAIGHFDLANILGRSGRFDEALSHYNAAIRLRPDYAKAHCNLGTTLVQMHRLQEAVAEYQLALKFDPGLAEARTNLERIEAYLQGGP